MQTQTWSVALRKLGLIRKQMQNSKRIAFMACMEIQCCHTKEENLSWSLEVTHIGGKHQFLSKMGNSQSSKQLNNESSGNQEFQYTVDYNLYSYHPHVILSFTVFSRDKGIDHLIYDQEHVVSKNVALLTKIIFDVLEWGLEPEPPCYCHCIEPSCRNQHNNLRNPV